MTAVRALLLICSEWFRAKREIFTIGWGCGDGTAKTNVKDSAFEVGEEEEWNSLVCAVGLWFLIRGFTEERSCVTELLSGMVSSA